MNQEIIFKKVNKNNIDQIIVLFSKVFKINISKKFYNWRYYNQHFKSYTSFVAVHKKKIIGHVGYFINTYNVKPYLASRHTSMIHNEYRSQNIYTNLLLFSFLFIKKEFKTNDIIIWPNENNLKVLNKICKKPILYKYNLYFKKFIKNKTKNFFSNNIKILNDFNFDYLSTKFPKKKYLFNKSSSYFNWRYKNYRKTDNFYCVIYDSSNSPKAIFIIKKEFKNNVWVFLILDYIYFSKYNLKKDLNFLILNKEVFFYNKKFVNFYMSIWCNTKDNDLKKFLRNKNFVLNNKKKYFLSYLQYKNNKIYTKKINYKNNIFMGDSDNFIKIDD